MTTHPGILIRWSPHAPETWTPRDADEPAPVPRSTPVVSVEGTPAVRLLRAAELGRIRDALHAHGLRVAVDTFDTLGPQSETTRGVDVTLGWDDVYDRDDLVAEAEQEPTVVTIHAHRADHTVALRSTVMRALDEVLDVLAHGADGAPHDAPGRSDATREQGGWPGIPAATRLDRILFAERRGPVPSTGRSAR